MQKRLLVLVAMMIVSSLVLVNGCGGANEEGFQRAPTASGTPTPTPTPTPNVGPPAPPNV